MDISAPTATAAPSGKPAADPQTVLFAPGVANDPHDAYRRLREECPVHRGPGLMGGNGVVLSRFEDIAFAFKHPAIFSSADAVAIGNERPLIPLQIDPPEHAKYRRLLDPEFGPKKVIELEADARKLVNEIIDRFIDQGECDFHADFSTPLPSTIFLRIMALPADDLPTFLRWRDNIIRPDTDDMDEAAEIRAATGRAIYKYFDQAIEQKISTPDDGLLSRLALAEIDGQRLTREELLDTCYLLILGGLDTVTATLDCFITYLARHPERRQQLVDDPSIAPAVVEELLRFETPVMMVPRVVIEDHELGGIPLHAGDSVMLLIGAGNGDDAEFAHADSVDFGREQNRHLSFGGGPHRCMGSHLARLELQVALEEFHRRIPEYRIRDGAELTFSPGIRQAEQLPLVFTPAPS
jgi:cytochrome P450